MTDTVNYQNPKPQFDIGRVFNRTFGAIKHNPKVFLITSLVVIGIPMFFIGLLPLFMGVGGIGGLEDPDALANLMTASIIASVVTVIFLLIASVVLQGALIFAAVKDFNNERATLGEAVGIGFRYFFPLIGLAILVTLGVLAGLVLLIIPGLLLALGWSIAAPILVIEGRSIADSIGRSWELTRGYKRWILLLWVILTIVSAIISAVLGLFTLLAGDPTTVLLEGGSTTFYLMNAFFSAIAQALSTMLGAAGIAAVYYEIRQIKEGVGAESLAAIFD